MAFYNEEPDFLYAYDPAIGMFSIGVKTKNVIFLSPSSNDQVSQMTCDSLFLDAEQQVTMVIHSLKKLDVCTIP